METMILNIILFLAYVVLVLWISYLYRARGKHAKGEFLIYDYELDATGMSLSALATALDSVNIIIAAGIAFMFGTGAFLIYGSSTLSLLIIALFAPKIWREFRKIKNVITPLDLFRDRFGHKTEVMGIIGIIFVSLIWITGGLSANKTVMKQMFGIGPYLATAISALIILLYMLWGGFRTVVKTDIFQMGVIFSILLLPIFIIRTQDLSTAFSGNIPTSLIQMLVYVFIINFFPYTLLHKVIAAKDEKVAVKGIIFYALGFLVLIIPLTLMSFTIKALIPEANPSDALFLAISKLLPAYFSSLVLIVFYSAVMSSLDTLIFSTSEMTAKNLLGVFKKNIDYVKYTKIFLVVYILVPSFIAIFVPHVVDFFVNWAALLDAFIPVFFLGLYRRFSDWSGSLSILAGIIATAIVSGSGLVIKNYLYGVVPFFVSLVVLIVVELLVTAISPKPRRVRSRA